MSELPFMSDEGDYLETVNTSASLQSDRSDSYMKSRGGGRDNLLPGSEIGTKKSEPPSFIMQVERQVRDAVAESQTSFLRSLNQKLEFRARQLHTPEKRDSWTQWDLPTDVDKTPPATDAEASASHLFGDLLSCWMLFRRTLHRRHTAVSEPTVAMMLSHENICHVLIIYPMDLSGTLTYFYGTFQAVGTCSVYCMWPCRWLGPCDVKESGDCIKFEFADRLTKGSSRLTIGIGIRTDITITITSEIPLRYL